MSRSTRRPSRASKYHQQYLSFLRKWKAYVHSSQYQECERLCLDHVDRIDRSIRFQMKQYSSRHGGAHLDYNDNRFSDIKNYRSKVRNLYAVLLHDYLKQHNDALEQYELCIEDDEYNASAHYNWAILYKNFFRDYDSAEVHYKKAIELKPNHAAYHNNYGLLLEQQLKKYDSAKKQFGIALQLDDKNGRAHTNMANLLKKHYQDYDTAKIHYQKAINLDPQNPTRHFNYALFLKHNLYDYHSAANEYEKAINLDHNYYQAHNEYKNFLLTESPFHRHHSKKHKKIINNSKSKPDDKKEHSKRCIKYAITLLWNKKIKDAKEIMQMAIKCQPNNQLAKLIIDPYQDYTDDLFDKAPYQIQQQQQQAGGNDYNLVQLQNRMSAYHKRLSNITSSLKQSALNQIQQQLSDDNDKASESQWTVNQLDKLTVEIGQELSRLNVKGGNQFGGSAVDAYSEGNIQSMYGNYSSQASGPGYYSNNNNDMNNNSGYNKNKKVKYNNGYNNSNNNGYNGNNNDDYLVNKKDQHLLFPNANNNGNSMLDNSNNNGVGNIQYNKSYGSNSTGYDKKRNSLISVNSASEFNQRYMDIHKQTLFSAAKILENMLNEQQQLKNNQYNHNSYYNNNQYKPKSLDDNTIKKLDDVMHMIFGTVRVWDYIDFDHPNNDDHHLSAKLTQNNINSHNSHQNMHHINGNNNNNNGNVNHNNNNNNNNNNNLNDDQLLNPDDGMFDNAKTLGAVSMISDISTAALEQRRTFLQKASRNKAVREQDRIAVKYIANQFLTTRTDTPKSVLSQSQLPFFSDEDQSDDDDDDNSNNNNNNVSKKQVSSSTVVTNAEIRVKQRVERWKSNIKLQEYLKNLNSWDFDVFFVVENAGNYAMPAIFWCLMESRGLVKDLNINVTYLCNYFHQISMEYKNNPYHNKFHGCDVLVNCNYFLNASLMKNIRKLDQFACLVAAAIHDVGHPGNNNAYEVQRESDLAVRYNDKSVLESMHIAFAWQILKRPGCNILSSLNKKEKKEFRKLFIEAVCSTDMAEHATQFKLLAELIDAVSNSGVDLDHLDQQQSGAGAGPDDNIDADNKSVVSSINIPPNCIYADPHKFATVVIPLMVHTADLSNPAKDLKLYHQWAKRIVTEFWNQAENEKKYNLDVTSYFDKDKVDIPTSQVAFVNHVIKPWMDLWSRLLRDKNQGPLYVYNVNENLAFMKNEMEKTKKKQQDIKQQKQLQSLSQKQQSPPPYTPPNGSNDPVTNSKKGKKIKKVFKNPNKPPSPPSIVNKNLGTDATILALSNKNNNKPVGMFKKQISVVDMTFEDINRVEMLNRRQRMEELKIKQNRDYYNNNNMNNANAINGDDILGNAGLYESNLNKTSSFDDADQYGASLQVDDDDNINYNNNDNNNNNYNNINNNKHRHSNKKMLYSGAQNNNNNYNNNNNNNNNSSSNKSHKNKKLKKNGSKKSKKKGNLTSIPELL